MRIAPVAVALAFAAGLLTAAGPGTAAVEAGPSIQLSGADPVRTNPGIPYHRMVTAPTGHAVAAWLEPIPASPANFQLMARHRAPGGEWSATEQVSATTTGAGASPVPSFELAMNATGDAALSWRQYDVFDGDYEHMAFAATLPAAGGAWTTSRVGGELYGVNGFDTPRVVVLPDGTAVTAWRGWADDEHARGEAYAAEGRDGTWGGQVRISDTSDIPVNCLPDAACAHGDIEELALAVDGAGEVRAHMVQDTDVEDGETQRRWVLRTSRGTGGGWSHPTPITGVQDPYVQPSGLGLVGDLAGNGFASAWSLAATAGEPTLKIRLQYDGQVRTFRHPDADHRLAGMSLADGHVAALLVAFDTFGELRVTSARAGGDGWSDLVDPALGEELSNAPMPRLGVHPDGAQTVMWVDDGRIRVTQRPSATAAWPDDHALAAAPSGQTQPLLSAGQDGSGAVVYRSSASGVPAIYTNEFAPEAAEPEPPAVTMLQPTRLLARSSAWTVAWQGTDQGGGVGRFEVGASETEWDEDASATHSVQEFGADEASFGVMIGPLGGGTTYCYAARGYAVGSDVPGAWSQVRCAATPVDDRTLTRVGTWAAKRGDGRWDGTYLQTKTKDARLKLAGVHASVVGLLVEKGPGHGRLKVVFDGQPLGTVDLAGAVKKRVVVPLEHFATAREGSLVLKVVSGNGKVVRVDGVYAAQPGDAAFGA